MPGSIKQEGDLSNHPVSTDSGRIIRDGPQSSAYGYRLDAVGDLEVLGLRVLLCSVWCSVRRSVSFAKRFFQEGTSISGTLGGLLTQMGMQLLNAALALVLAPLALASACDVSDASEATDAKGAADAAQSRLKSSDAKPGESQSSHSLSRHTLE